MSILKTAVAANLNFHSVGALPGKKPSGTQALFSPLLLALLLPLVHVLTLILILGTSECSLNCLACLDLALLSCSPCHLHLSRFSSTLL